MQGKELVKLAADFSSGAVTAAFIKERYGDGVLTTVIALAAGGVAGLLTDAAIDLLDDRTGIVSTVGDTVLDVGRAVGGIFDIF